MTVTFRALTRADLAVVGSLVADSFEARLAPFMIATQHGWADFVGVALDHPGHFPAQRLHVAEVDGRVVGFADFRAPGDGTGFLSYICVAPAARGRGIARGSCSAPACGEVATSTPSASTSSRTTRRREPCMRLWASGTMTSTCGGRHRSRASTRPRR